MDAKTDGAQSEARLWLTSGSDLGQKVIPPGTKVFFRWVNRTEILGASVEAQKKAQSEGPTDDRTAPFGDGAFLAPSLHSSADGPFSAFIVLLSLIGIVLVLLLAFFLVRLFHGGDSDDDNSMRRREDGSPRHLRELQVVLVPKGRRKSSLALINPFGLGDKKHLIERKETVAGFGLQPKKGTTRPFPRRIYELQAEEGYFSCPQSMRSSFELD